MNTRVQGSTTIFANETNTPEPTSNKSPTPTRAVAKAVRDLAAPAESDSVDKGVEVTDLDFSPTPQDRYGNGATPSMASASSHTTGTADTKSAFNIKLPNGVQISVGALIRLLDRATTHETTRRDGQTFFFFRGYDGLDLWSILFFEDDDDAEKVVAFGRMLIARGILHNYTPNCEDFANCFLVLQPLQEPRVLNTFVRWPTNHVESRQEDPMDVILRLSRLADEVCNKPGDRRNLPLFHELEEAVAQLQVIGFPSRPIEKVTFALNLFNLVIRHAMIVAQSRGWTWPQRLDELEAFFSRIGYNVGGDWISLAELQTSLYGRSGQESPVLVAERPRWWRLHCQGGEKDLHYLSPMVHTDPRILMAISFGCLSSPKVETVYPNRLEEGLQTAAEIYCQQHVLVGFDRVVLPALLSWHRADFGTDPEQVLRSILPYLSVLQLRQLQDLHEAGRIQVGFDESFRWKCGVGEHIAQQHMAAGLHRINQPAERKSLAAPHWLQNNRQPSCGEGQLFAPSRDLMVMPYDQTDVTYPEDEEDQDKGQKGDAEDDDGHSFFQSVVSEITVGSEFEDLVPFSSRQRLRMQRLRTLQANS